MYLIPCSVTQSFFSSRRRYEYSISQARFQESCHILPHLLRFKVLDDLAIALDDFLLHV
jgi:hypothetical protein